MCHGNRKTIKHAKWISWTGGEPGTTEITLDAALATPPAGYPPNTSEMTYRNWKVLPYRSMEHYFTSKDFNAMSARGVTGIKIHSVRLKLFNIRYQTSSPTSATQIFTTSEPTYSVHVDNKHWFGDESSSTLIDKDYTANSTLSLIDDGANTFADILPLQATKRLVTYTQLSPAYYQYDPFIHGETTTFRGTPPWSHTWINPYPATISLQRNDTPTVRVTDSLLARMTIDQASANGWNASGPQYSWHFVNFQESGKSQAQAALGKGGFNNTCSHTVPVISLRASSDITGDFTVKCTYTAIYSWELEFEEVYTASLLNLIDDAAADYSTAITTGTAANETRGNGVAIVDPFNP